MKRSRMFNSFFQPRIGISAIALIGTLAGTAEAAITPWDSTNFNYKFEMDNVGEGVDPGGNTAEFTRGYSPPGTASLSNGFLNVSTLSNGSMYWDSLTWGGAVSPSTGFTVEIRLRIDDSLDGSGKNRAFDMIAYTGTGKVGGLDIGTDGTYFEDAVVVTQLGSTQNNTNDYHVFRIAEDANSTVFQAWRDGVQIGTNVVSTFAVAGEDFYFADGTGSFSGVFSVDYVRWTTGAYSPVTVPEPTGVALIGLAGLALLRRRTRKG